MHGFVLSGDLPAEPGRTHPFCPTYVFINGRNKNNTEMNIKLKILGGSLSMIVPIQIVVFHTIHANNTELVHPFGKNVQPLSDVLDENVRNLMQ